MANEKTIYTESFIASGSLAALQYHAVKLSGNRTVVALAAETDIPVGVLLNEPGDTEEALVMIVGRCPVVLEDTIAAGELIYFNEHGHAIGWEATDTTVYAVGQCTIGGDSGEVGEMIIGVAPLTTA